MNRSKIAILISSLGISIAAVAYCPPQYQETFVQPIFMDASVAISTALSAVDTALATLLEYQSQRLTSAIAVLTKQKAITANQIAEGNKTSAQVLAAGMKTLELSARMTDARFNYGPEYGQGLDPCKTYAKRSLIAAREDTLKEDISLAVTSEVNAAPGRYASPSLAAKAMAADHREKYCTSDEKESGLCSSVGTLAGADLSAATLFTPSMQSEAMYGAKVSFVNNLVGLPDAPVPNSAASTPAAQRYMAEKMRKDAILSPAITSIQAIKTDYTGTSNSHDGTSLPLIVFYRSEVAKYFGSGSEYNKWTSGLAGQNERGLLVELLKQKALDLALMHKKYQQYERMEATLASLTAIASSKIQQDVEQVAQEAARQNAKAQIR